MKPFLNVIVLLAITATCFWGFYSKDNAYSELLLENIEAIADPEVDVEAICMGSDEVCILYSNGFFIFGMRVA